MKQLKPFLVLMITLFLAGCKKDNDSLVNSNENPESFAVTVSEVTGTTATLQWELAPDPDGDRVTYGVWLGEEKIQTDLGNTKISLQNLIPESSYTGKVVASDDRGGITESVFAFNTGEIAIEWERSFGGSGDDVARSIIQTMDEGFVVAGYSTSLDGDVGGNNGSSDCWVVKLDNSGNLIWETNLGGAGSDGIYSILQVADGGFVAAGESSHFSGDVGGNNGGRDVWVMKLNASGNLVWETNLGGSGTDVAYSLQQTLDGGYVVAGTSGTANGDVGDNQGGNDFWIVKLDINGSLIWESNFGGSDGEGARSVQQTLDGGYIVAGASDSSDGDVNGNQGGSDLWIIKLDSFGNLIWESSMGGSGTDRAHSIRETSKGEYVVAGFSYSSGGNVGGNNGGGDYWIVKLDALGNQIWETNLGGEHNDFAYVIQSFDKGHIAAGFTVSNEGDVGGGNKGQSDYWITMLDDSGSLIWEKNFGGSNGEQAYAILHIPDEGYVVAGSTESSDGDVKTNKGGHDFWIIKLK